LLNGTCVYLDEFIFFNQEIMIAEDGPLFLYKKDSKVEITWKNYDFFKGPQSLKNIKKCIKSFVFRSPELIMPN